MPVPWRILIVDDEPDVLASMHDLAWGLPGVIVDQAASLNAAMAFVRSHDYQVVVADHRLGDGTGVDLLAWISHRSPSSALVLTSAYQDFDMLLEAVNKAHIHNFVAKPWEPDAFQRLLHSLVEEQRVLERGMRALARAPEEMPLPSGAAGDLGSIPST